MILNDGQGKIGESELSKSFTDKINNTIGDTDLITTNKTIKGAINEVNGNLGNLQESVTSHIQALEARPQTDIHARKEIIDIKLKLEEQQAIDFVNKTGIGFYDNFADNSNIDTVNTTATYDSANKLVDFPYSNYTVKSTGNYDNLAVINVDKQVTIGDKLDNLNTILDSVIKDSSAIYDRTTPVSVVGSAYTTSATARPQVLSNGWIVTMCTNGSSVSYFYVSKDNGATFTQLCYADLSSSITHFSLCSFETNVYALLVSTTGAVMRFVKFDATTVTNTLQTLITIDTQTSFASGCSIAVSSTGALTASWCSTNPTYAVAFNIRSAKSVDGGVTWTKQDGTSGIDQITSTLLSGQNIIEPYVQYDKNDIPVILYRLNQASGTGLFYSNFTTSWSAFGKYIYTPNGNYPQYNPIATLQKYGVNAGRIWVTWYGTDGTSASNNIRYSYSDDNGVTWCSMQKLPVSEISAQTNPTIASDTFGNVYITWSGVSSVNLNYVNIRQQMWDGTIWSSTTEITAQNTVHMGIPSTCDNYNNFTNPITIWKDSKSSRVAFCGKFVVGSKTYDITLTNPVTVTNGQELSIYPSPKVLKLNNETFDTFNSMELALYPSKISNATIKGNVDNSNTVITGATDKTLSIGDKLFMNNVLNEVLGCTGNFSDYTVTDATVVASAYNTNGNGGRKLVRLNDGTLVSATRYGNTNYQLFKSIDNGLTWTPLITLTPSGNVANDIALTTNGVYLFAITTDNGTIKAYNIDLKNKSILFSYDGVDSSQTGFGNVSAIINPDGTELHTCWSSKNSTYPNSYNIRYTKGIINADGSVTWGAVIQVTTKNTTGYNINNPTIIIKSDNTPVIIYEHSASGGFYISCKYWNGSAFVGSTQDGTNIYALASYTQSSPSAIFVPQNINGLAQGRIWVAWQGKDATDTSIFNIRISYSDDGGLTWSTMQKLTQLTTFNALLPSITVNKSNKIFIVYSVDDNNYARKLEYDGSQWIKSDISTVVGTNPSTLIDFSIDFAEPLFICNGTSKVSFYGTWTVGEGYTLTMQNPVTLANGDKVPIIDMSVQQDNTDMQLKTIDSEKFTYVSDNLNTSIADIKILGKDTKLNTIAYSIC